MYLGGQWYQCRIHEKDKSSDPVENLDVFILQEKVLAPLFGIIEPKTDARISFAGGIRGLDYLEDAKVDGGWAVAFAMQPDLDRGTVCGCGRRKTDAAKIQLV